MNTLSSILSTSCFAAGNAFYAHHVSRNATEERSVSNLSNKAHEAVGGVLDTLYGLFVKAFPQTLFTIAFTSQLHHHLTLIGASKEVLSVSLLGCRILPSLPLLIAAAPLLGFADSLSKKQPNLGNVVGNGIIGFQSGRYFQKLGNYSYRALEFTYAALLISRVVQNDGRIGAVVGLATLVAGFVYRYELLNRQSPAASSLLDKVFTWSPSSVTYALGGAALLAGPTRIMAIFMLSFQGMRDFVLTSGTEAMKKS